MIKLTIKRLSSTGRKNIFKTRLVIVLSFFAILTIFAIFSYQKSRLASPSSTPISGKFACTATPTFNGYHTLWWYQPEYKNLCDLDIFLNTIYSHNHNDELFLSISWDSVEQKEDKFDFSEVDKRVDKIIAKGLRLYIILDAGTDNPAYGLTSVPNYIWSKYPDCRSTDFNGQTNLVSFSDDGCIQKAYGFFAAAVKHFNGKYGQHVIAYQPSFNNEYEVRYAQFNYAWQDYSLSAAQAFRAWLEQQNGDISYWAARWGMRLASFSQINPTIVNYNRDTAPDAQQLYYDWQRFREDKIVEVYAKATDIIHKELGKVIYHFGEWMTANDGISTAPLIPLVSKTKVDYMVIDSNLQDTKENKNDPVIGAILASSVKRLNIPITYEAAVERMDLNSEVDRFRITESLRLAAHEGLSAVSLTNLLQPSLEQKLLPPKEKAPVEKTCKQVIYYSRWQSYAFHGATSWVGSTPKDPLQTQLFDTYKANRTKGCVEIWDDEMVTAENLKHIDTIILTDALVMKQSSLDAINKEKHSGFSIIRNDDTAKYIIDNHFIFRTK